MTTIYFYVKLFVSDAFGAHTFVLACESRFPPTKYAVRLQHACRGSEQRSKVMFAAILKGALKKRLEKFPSSQVCVWGGGVQEGARGADS